MDWRKRSRFVCVIWAIVVVGLTCVSQSYAQSTTEGAIGEPSLINRTPYYLVSASRFETSPPTVPPRR